MIKLNILLNIIQHKIIVYHIINIITMDGDPSIVPCFHIVQETFKYHVWNSCYCLPHSTLYIGWSPNLKISRLYKGCESNFCGSAYGYVISLSRCRIMPALLIGVPISGDGEC